jgi:DNA-binding XRE family transcriptional regulator
VKRRQGQVPCRCPRTGDEQAVGKAAARQRREAYVQGHQLAEMRTTAGVTQAEFAAVLGVSQARISKIEYGEILGIDVVRAYVCGLAEALMWSQRSATVENTYSEGGRPHAGVGLSALSVGLVSESVSTSARPASHYDDVDPFSGQMGRPFLSAGLRGGELSATCRRRGGRHE